MSDDALRLASAQERLDRALAKHGPNSRAARDAELGLRRALRETTAEANRASAAIDHTGREVSQLSRGAVVGSGAMRGLGRSVAFASATFLGSAGLVYAIRASIREATEQSKILANVRNALEASGHSWAQYGARIEAATQATKRASAFDDEELYKSLQLLIRGTRDVNRALELNALAADVARGRNMGLVQAATLLVRVNAGQVGSLRRLGIEVDKNIDGHKALEQVQRQYAGAAKAFSDSAAGAQERWTVAVGDFEKAIGRGLLPTLTDLLGTGSDWLAQDENLARVERDVASAADQLVTAGRAVIGVLEDAHDVTAPLVDVVGGLENAIRLLLIAMAVNKVRLFVGSLGTVGPAATAAATEVAAAEGKIAASGTSAGIAAGRVSGLAGALKTLGAIGVITVGVDLFLRYKTDSGVTLNQDALARVSDAELQRALDSGNIPASLRSAIAAYALARGQAAIAAGYAGIEAARSSPEAYAALTGRQEPPLLSGSANVGPGPLTAAQRRRRDLATYAGTGTADEIRAVQEQANYDRRALASLEQRRRAGKIANDKYVAQYESIYGDLVSREQRLAQIADDNAEKAKKAVEKRKAAELRAAVAATRSGLAGVGPLGVRGGALAVAAGLVVPSDVVAAAARAQARIPGGALGVKGGFLGGLTPGVLPEETELELRIAAARADSEKQLIPILRREVDAYEAQLQVLRIGHGKRLDVLKVRAAIAETNRRIRDISDRDQAATGGGAVANQRQFLAAFQQIVGAYAPNAFPVGARGGKSETHLYEAVHELRQQTNVLHRLAGHEAFPVTRHAYSSALAAFG